MTLKEEIDFKNLEKEEIEINIEEEYNDFSCPNAEKKFKEITGVEFIKFYTTYKPKLEWVLFKMCADKDECSDIATDAFIRSLHKIDQYNPEYKFSTWLFTIAKRIMLERIKNKRQYVSIDQEYDEEFTLQDVLANNDELDNDGIKDIQKAEIIKNKIFNLKDKYKTVMIMRELNQESYLDISKKLGENLSTIKSRIRNSRLILRREVEQEFRQLDNA